MKITKKQFNFVYQSILGIAILFLLYKNFSSEGKVVYVDSGKLLSEYKGAIKAREELEKKSAQYQSNIDTLTNEIRGAIQVYEKELATKGKEEQAKAREAIGNKQKELANYQSSVKENLNKENSKALGGVVANVNSYLQEYGKEHGYKMILIANPSGTIAYAREELDVTADILKKLNDEYQAK